MLARPSSVAPANSLQKIVNMDVQPGGWLRSRPKWKRPPGNFTIPPQWKGLESNAGYLWTFSCGNVASTGLTSAIINTDTSERILYAFRSTGTGGSFASATTARLVGLTRWNNGFVTVLSPDNGTTSYPTLFAADTALNQANATNITDVNMPKTGLMVTATGRIYSISNDGQTVRFCKVGDPTDWTAAGNAGFLPVSQHFASGQRAYALGLYQGKLAVFTDQSIQLWNIDPDPTLMTLDRVVDGVGTRHHNSLISLYGDLIFLSESGIRSLTTLSNSLFPSDVDIGLPIKMLTSSPTQLTRASNGSVVPAVTALAANPMSQYWIAAPGIWFQE